MTTTAKTSVRPAASPENKRLIDDATTNDSLGTVSPADSTGSDETKETGDAKSRNLPTHED